MSLSPPCFEGSSLRRFNEQIASVQDNVAFISYAFDTTLEYPTSFDPQGLSAFKSSVTEIQYAIYPQLHAIQPETPPDSPTCPPSYIDSIQFLVNHFGSRILAKLDAKGFTVLHYVAGMVHEEDQILELVEYVLKEYSSCNGNNQWDPTSLEPHPLMLIAAKPVYDGSLFAAAATNAAQEYEYQKRLVSMKGYFPLAVATRGGNLSAIKIFIDNMNASPFTTTQPKYIGRNEVFLSNSAALQVALDHGLANALHILLETALTKIKHYATPQTAGQTAASRLLSPKTMARKPWPERLLLNDSDFQDQPKMQLEVWDIRDAYGVTPLHAACGSKLSDELALVIIESLKFRKSTTRKQNMIEILIHHNASSIFARDCSGRTIIVTSILMSRSPAFLHNLLNLPAMKAMTPSILIKNFKKQSAKSIPCPKMEARKFLMQIGDWEHGKQPNEWAECMYGNDSSVGNLLKAYS
ncbi:UNVERIFIED_CONTAM: hypothetical protein HDU68_006856 [Siphonaria sp. JEL0065]|nr:hypothetical protein HDU68_006850 [Siphonaria sp. JEL0065]KAJ3032083.1 hypothetical protein HDU68_006856 [Siphonaria sp. JEL0065]